MKNDNVKPKIKNPKDNYKIERAIKFLVHKFEESPRKDKPEILHGIKVGSSLYDYGYETKIVIAGILHDLLEETKTTFKEVKKKFDKEIADLIMVNSYDIKNSDKLQRCIDCYNNCLKYGKDALIIKTADLLSNMPYIKFVKDQRTKKYLFTKWRYFIKISNPEIGKEKVYRDLKREFKKLQ